MTRFLLATILLFGTYILQAQSDLRLGEWQAFLPFAEGITVSQSTEKIFYGTNNGLLTIDKETGQESFFSKEDGLNDVGIRLVKYDSDQNALVIAYSNSNLDIVYDSEIVNLNNILNNNVIVGDRQINDVYTDDSRFIYLSCSFGLVQLDMETLKFGFTLYTDDPVRSFTIFEGKHWMATDAGLFTFDSFGTALESDFSNWDYLDLTDGLPENYSAQAITVHEGALYAGINNDLYVYDDSFLLIYTLEGYTVRFISPEASVLMLGMRCVDDACNGKVLFFDGTDLVGESGFNCSERPTYALEDELGQVWYADEFPEFRIATDLAFGCNRKRYNTPYSESASDLEIVNGTLYLASGGIKINGGNANNKGGFSIFRDGNWQIFNQFNNEELAAFDVQDFYQIETLPDESRVYVGTFWGGLIEYDFETFMVYDAANSLLRGTMGDGARERITGMALDKDLNLWMSNWRPNGGKPIVVKKPDGEWFSFKPSCTSSTSMAQMTIDQRGYKWFVDGSTSSGILVYDDNGTLEDTIDDRCMSFSSSNSALPSNTVLSIVTDLDGDIWVGTNEGPVIFDGGPDIFDGNHEGFRIKIQQDDLTFFLLSEEEILSIGIDGANRKWLGTRNGVFVQSANGEDQVAFYNVDNSPLLDNQVNEIAINQYNGQVFFATNEGVISVRSKATTGRPFHVEAEVYAFPNPVRENYEGDIAIRGLARDATVKITDIQGQLIFETRALGGQAIWNGKDFSGRRASSGVYLVFSSVEPNGFTKPDAFVTKILMVK